MQSDPVREISFERLPGEDDWDVLERLFRLIGTVVHADEGRLDFVLRGQAVAVTRHRGGIVVTVESQRAELPLGELQPDQIIWIVRRMVAACARVEPAPALGRSRLPRIVTRKPSTFDKAGLAMRCGIDMVNGWVGL